MENQRMTFVKKFIPAAALAVIPVALIPEAWFLPANRLTAFLAGTLLRLLSVDPVIRGTAIRAGGFSVNVIAECTGLHLILLYGAFIASFPGDRQRKWIGFAAGALFLYALNILRITAVTLIGRDFPRWFEVSHIYLGQFGMATALVALCLEWRRIAQNPEGRNGPKEFLLRFLLFSAVPFLLWVPLNLAYMQGIDATIRFFFSLTGHPLMMPHTHRLYYQTFSLVVLVGLVAAVKGVPLKQRLGWMGGGLAILTLFQIANRLCNVGTSAFGLGWLFPIAQVIHITGVYVLPAGIALCCFRFSSRRPSGT